MSLRVTFASAAHILKNVPKLCTAPEYDTAMGKGGDLGVGEDMDGPGGYYAEKEVREGQTPYDLIPMWNLKNR